MFTHNPIYLAQVLKGGKGWGHFVSRLQLAGGILGVAVTSKKTLFQAQGWHGFIWSTMFLRNIDIQGKQVGGESYTVVKLNFVLWEGKGC